jgi:hypothetical protein
VRLVVDHSLVVAPGQSLSMLRQEELLGLLGPILHRRGENGYISNTTNSVDPEHSELVDLELSFHSDGSLDPLRGGVAHRAFACARAAGAPVRSSPSRCRRSKATKVTGT